MSGLYNILTGRHEAQYAQLKSRWAERMLAALHKHYPQTEGRVVAVDISTPLTIENYLRSGKGAAIGLDVTPARFVDEDEAALPGRAVGWRQ
ncbi:hypothetical protein EMIHUDRAFT_235826 [Emiliania huxleyi CCMP1516]|uniref:Uncharacterized protein n=2 Tax=Emiliania huxleyi TaxID=2903 RepID=A0A0D3JVD5_EMIH1|nr:hypothetical protein EMIHUDRAFT_235826 [Emiliania huxleyi CCMP1516]EOD27470.1 hypothetical protein EMIHUDRAFT_235826 [Emiliania huxleyi CCMP1516]|eukprot:XP_005779899.1 hypothetical protein EMIHUDRAFT_235826 [Emiliania huxleyi CCMP1516]